MLTRTAGVAALATVTALVGACCRRPCDAPATVATPSGDHEVVDLPFEGPGDTESPPPVARTTAKVTVLDADGRPVPAATVRAWGGPPRRGFVSRGGPLRYRTDASGIAVLENLVASSTYDLAVAAPRDRPDLRDAPALKDWRPRDETVRLRRWRVIKGVVKDADGRPVVGVGVHSRERLDDAWIRGFTDDAGRFMLERVADGTTFAVVVEVSDGLMTWGADHPPRSIEAGTVTAGDENVVLLVDVGKELVVTLEEPDGRPSSEHARAREFDAVASLWLPAPGGDGALASAEAFVRRGIARFRGLRAHETYSLWMTPSKDGNIVYETDVRAGERRVVRRPGKPITVNVRAPATATLVSAWVRGPFVDFGSARRSPPGPLEIRGVPDGTWRVYAWAKVGDEFWHGSGTAAAGSSIDIEVKPLRPSR